MVIMMFSAGGAPSEPAQGRTLSSCSPAARRTPWRRSGELSCSCPGCSPGCPACSGCLCGWESAGEPVGVFGVSWCSPSARSRGQQGWREHLCDGEQLTAPSSTCGGGGETVKEISLYVYIMQVINMSVTHNLSHPFSSLPAPLSAVVLLLNI